MRSIRSGKNAEGRQRMVSQKRPGPQDKITLVLTRNQIGALIALVQRYSRERYELPPNSILTRELPGTLAALEQAFSGQVDDQEG